MSIASGFTKMKNYILTSSGYKLLSRWTSSQTVHMGDGTDDTDTVEYRFGAMKGVTSSLATDNDEFALSASAGKNLQDQCTQLNQSLTNIENGQINFVSTINVGANSLLKRNDIVFGSFEFNFKTGYPFTGNVKIGDLPFSCIGNSYTGVAWVSSSNQCVSVYVKGNALYMQSLITVPENTAIRGFIIYYT